MIPESTRRSPIYTGDGVGAIFPFSFPVLSPGDVKVYLRPPSQAAVEVAGVSVELNPDQEVAPGGSVTLSSPPAAGWELVIVGGRDYEQTTNLPDQGPFLPSNIEAALDSLEIQIQQLREQVARTAQVSPLTDPDTLDDWFIDDEVATVQALVADIEARYLGALADNPATDPPEGTLYWNSTEAEMRVFNGTTWQPAVELIAPVSEGYTGDGATFTFVLPQVSTTDGTLVVVDDIYQEPNTNYTVSGNVLTFSSPPADQSSITATVLGVPGTVIFVGGGGGGGGGGSGSGTFQLEDGTVSTPSLSFINDTDSGIYRLPAGTDPVLSPLVGLLLEREPGPILGGVSMSVGGERLLSLVVGDDGGTPEPFGIGQQFWMFSDGLGVEGATIIFGGLYVYDDIDGGAYGGKIQAEGRIETDEWFVAPTTSDGTADSGYAFGGAGADFAGIQMTNTSSSGAMLLNVNNSTRLRLTGGTTHYLGGSSFSNANHMMIAGNTPKAWAVINGNGSFTLVKGFNVTGGSRISTGYYQIQFGTPMPSTNYAVIGTGVRGNESLCVGVRAQDKTTTGCNIRVDVVGDNNAGDADQLCLMVLDF